VLCRLADSQQEFLDSLSSLRSHHPNPQSIVSRPTYSRKAARAVLSAYDAKEIRRGADQLRSRIEKHFGHGEDESKSRELVVLVWKECERAYERTLERVNEMIRELYPPLEGEKAVEAGFTAAEVKSAFGK
jgi:exocyst complex component 1